MHQARTPQSARSLSTKIKLRQQQNSDSAAIARGSGVSKRLEGEGERPRGVELLGARVGGGRVRTDKSH
eukprot:scaffold114970_cov27-Tisochrysis_lutea.AAC.1